MGKLDNLFNKIDEEGFYDMKSIFSQEKAKEIINYLYSTNEYYGFQVWWNKISRNQKNKIINEISKIIESNVSNKLKPEETVSDGFGSTWSKKCPTCGKDEIFVVRPGKVECGNCGY